MNPNEIPRNNAKDRVIIVKDGRWYEAVNAKPESSLDQEHIWVSVCATVNGALMAQLKVTEIDPLSTSTESKERWRILAIPSAHLVQAPGDISYPTKEAAAYACIAMIGDDMGVSSGNYDPDLWGGLQWADHSRNIRDTLMEGENYSYLDRVWGVYRSMCEGQRHA